MIVKTLSNRIQNAEQILDTHLDDGLGMTRGSVGPVRNLAAALNDWDRALHAAMVDMTPDARVLLVSANLAVELLRRIGDIATEAAAIGNLDQIDVNGRLIPALNLAAHDWDIGRHTWRVLAPVATGIPRQVALAAHNLHEALYQDGLSADMLINQSLRLAVTAAVEMAHLQVHATVRPDLKGTARGVASLTQATFEHVPGARSLELWQQLERLDGPSLITIPTAVHAQLLRQTARTLSTATMAASASHCLVRLPSRSGAPDGRTGRTLEESRPRKLASPRHDEVPRR
jgi:hypothetical protein